MNISKLPDGQVPEIMELQGVWELGESEGHGGYRRRVRYEVYGTCQRYGTCWRYGSSRRNGSSGRFRSFQRYGSRWKYGSG